MARLRPLKLMPDYHCHPIWWDTTHPDWESWNEVGNVDPRTLGLSEALASDLEAWAEEFDKRLDWDNPARSTTTEDEDRVFRARGAELAERLADELRESASVRYAY